VCIFKKDNVLLLPAGVGCLVWWVCWAPGRYGLGGEGDNLAAGRERGKFEATGAHIHFWELRKELWQAWAKPPIRLRNSWKSSFPSLLKSSFFIMRSRTPGSFWFCKDNNKIF
jgi:hypothetical protein